jgi:hypothetical protein
MLKRTFYFGLLLVLSCCIACENKKFVDKIITLKPGLDLVWFHYSLITSNGPDIVEFNDKKADREQVIFKAHGICQIKIKSDSILILMQGHSIIDQARENDYNFKIIIDTTCRSPYLYK